MKALQRHQTEYTPEIDFNAETRQLRISGVSRPENSVEFYAPVVKWLTEFLAVEAGATGVSAKVEVHVELDYFNSISAKYLVSMLIQLKDALAGTGRLEIMWYYDFLDNETLE